MRPAIDTMEQEFFEAMKRWDTETMDLCIGYGVDPKHRRKEITEWMMWTRSDTPEFLDFIDETTWIECIKENVTKLMEESAGILTEYNHGYVWLLNYYLSKGERISGCHAGTTIGYSRGNSDIGYMDTFTEHPVTQDVLCFNMGLPQEHLMSLEEFMNHPVHGPGLFYADTRGENE